MARPRKSHCKRGHELTPENTRTDPKGRQRCRECAREYQRAYHQRPGMKERQREYRQRPEVKARREQQRYTGPLTVELAERLYEQRVLPRVSREDGGHSSECWRISPRDSVSARVHVDGASASFIARRVVATVTEQRVLVPGRGVDSDVVVPTCHNGWCVNPDHLEVMDGGAATLAGNGMGARNARKTHCSHGHEMTPENTQSVPGHSGRKQRRCIACHGKGLPQAERDARVRDELVAAIRADAELWAEHQLRDGWTRRDVPATPLLMAYADLIEHMGTTVAVDAAACELSGLRPGAFVRRLYDTRAGGVATVASATTALAVMEQQGLEPSAELTAAVFDHRDAPHHIAARARRDSQRLMQLGASGLDPAPRAAAVLHVWADCLERPTTAAQVVAFRALVERVAGESWQAVNRHMAGIPRRCEASDDTARMVLAVARESGFDVPEEVEWLVLPGPGANVEALWSLAASVIGSEPVTPSDESTEPDHVVLLEQLVARCGSLGRVARLYGIRFGTHPESLRTMAGKWRKGGGCHRRTLQNLRALDAELRAAHEEVA